MMLYGKGMEGKEDFRFLMSGVSFLIGSAVLHTLQPPPR